MSRTSCSRQPSPGRIRLTTTWSTPAGRVRRASTSSRASRVSPTGSAEPTTTQRSAVLQRGRDDGVASASGAPVPGPVTARPAVDHHQLRALGRDPQELRQGGGTDLAPPVGPRQAGQHLEVLAHGAGTGAQPVGVERPGVGLTGRREQPGGVVGQAELLADDPAVWVAVHEQRAAPVAGARGREPGRDGGAPRGAVGTPDSDDAPLRRCGAGVALRIGLRPARVVVRPGKRRGARRRPGAWPRWRRRRPEPTPICPSLASRSATEACAVPPLATTPTTTTPSAPSRSTRSRSTPGPGAATTATRAVPVAATASRSLVSRQRRSVTRSGAAASAPSASGSQGWPSAATSTPVTAASWTPIRASAPGRPDRRPAGPRSGPGRRPPARPPRPGGSPRGR